MLEFCKKVLLRVGHNREKFQRELAKSIRHLRGDELKKLHAWCLQQFAHQYNDIIRHSFEGYALG